jgi:pimeloyl-ACP methyl ester carboxylesterase
MPTYRQPGLVITDHTFGVPLDHADPGGEQIGLFAREVAAADRAAATLPWLLFFQGGPGFGAPRPLGPDGWLERALASYRVLLLDQRGTGRSTPATRQSLARLGTPQAQARYLAHFRADSIVRDAELIRGQLAGGEPWSVLGQSFGGFCAVSYLSLAPAGLREVFITGGLPGLGASAADVYRLSYPEVAARNRAHYQRYPMDVARARQVARHLDSAAAGGGQVRLPGGGLLTVPAFQSLGRLLGASTGSATLHYLLEDAFAGGELSDGFLHQVHAHLSFAQAPLYALLHEACYAQGTGATGWAAERVRAEFAEFDPAAALAGDAPLFFTGEMIYPWMFSTDPALAPLRDAAGLLAGRADWPALYDAGQLAAAGVPAAAAVYFHDMYVPTALSLVTAAAITGLRTWVTSEYEHDGLRVSNGRVLSRLLDLAQGRA